MVAFTPGAGGSMNPRNPTNTSPPSAASSGPAHRSAGHPEDSQSSSGEAVVDRPQLCASGVVQPFFAAVAEHPVAQIDEPSRSALHVRERRSIEPLEHRHQPARAGEGKEARRWRRSLTRRSRARKTGAESLRPWGRESRHGRRLRNGSPADGWRGPPPPQCAAGPAVRVRWLLRPRDRTPRQASTRARRSCRPM